VVRWEDGVLRSPTGEITPSPPWVEGPPRWSRSLTAWHDDPAIPSGAPGNFALAQPARANWSEGVFGAAAGHFTPGHRGLASILNPGDRILLPIATFAGSASATAPPTRCAAMDERFPGRPLRPRHWRCQWCLIARWIGADPFPLCVPCKRALEARAPLRASIEADRRANVP
jgi:hypothetical protein